VTDDTATSYRAVIAGSIAADVGDAPPTAAVVVMVDHPALAGRPVEGRLFVVGGFAEWLLLPLVASVTFTAAGFETTTLAVSLPANASFPVDTGVVTMRRQPIRLQGRVVENTAARAPIGAALVTVVTAGAIALRTPAHFDHAAGVAVRQRALDPAGAARQLAAAARSSVTSIVLDDASGLAPGDVLRLGTAMESEYVAVAAVGPGVNELTLTSSLRRSFAAGAGAQPITPGATGPARNLARDTRAGESLLLLTGALAASTIEIADGPAPEYAATGVLTNAEGFYRLDAASGLGAVDLKVSAAGFTEVTEKYALDFGQPVNFINFRLSP
jgi:hypothetical protein